MKNYNKELKYSELKDMLKQKNLISFNRKISKQHSKELGKSLKQWGLLRSPIVGDVSSFDNNRKYVIVDGQNLTKALVDLGFNNKQPVNCIIKEYKNKQELITDISILNTTQKKWSDLNFLDAWYNYGNDNIKYWSNYSHLYRLNYDVYPKLSIGIILAIFTKQGNRKKIDFKKGNLTFFDIDFSNKLITIANTLKEKHNKPAHTIMGLILWAKEKYKKKYEIDFVKLNSRLSTALRTNEDKNYNGRDDFKEFIETIYNRV